MGATKDVAELKGLSDLKTAITAHLRSKPAQEGTEYLELYLASNERKRLAKLTRTWEKQQRRAQERHAAVSESVAKLEKKVGLEKTPGQAPLRESSADDGPRPAPDYTRRQWKTMSLDY